MGRSRANQEEGVSTIADRSHRCTPHVARRLAPHIYKARMAGLLRWFASGPRPTLEARRLKFFDLGHQNICLELSLFGIDRFALRVEEDRIWQSALPITR